MGNITTIELHHDFAPQILTDRDDTSIAYALHSFMKNGNPAFLEMWGNVLKIVGTRHSSEPPSVAYDATFRIPQGVNIVRGEHVGGPRYDGNDRGPSKEMQAEVNREETVAEKLERHDTQIYSDRDKLADLQEQCRRLRADSDGHTHDHLKAEARITRLIERVDGATKRLDYHSEFLTKVKTWFSKYNEVMK